MLNLTERVKVRMYWLRHAGKMARTGNGRGYTMALRVLNELEGVRLSQL